MADANTGGQPKQRPTIQIGALLFAMAGALAFGWVIGQGSRPDAFAGQKDSDTFAEEPPPVAKAVPKEAPVTQAKEATPIPPLPVNKTPEPFETKGGPQSHQEVKKTPNVVVPTPLATRGPKAVVRWCGADGPALALLEEGKSGEAAVWSAKSDLDAHTRGNLAGRACLAAGDYKAAHAAFLPQGKAKGPAGADARFGLALCAARGEARSISQAALEDLLDYRDSWGGAMAALEYARRLDAALLDNALFKGQRFQDAAALFKNEELARHYYQQALFSDYLLLADEQTCQKRLDELTMKILLNPNRLHMGFGLPASHLHKVQPGDSLTRIAKTYKVTIGSICRVNGLEPQGILRAGKTLKVVGGDVSVRVDRWRLTATLLVDGVYLMRAPVGIGPGEKTPTGKFTVRIKIIKPDWYYGGQRIPFGDKRNILGTRWLGFDDKENGGLGAGLGLHGTTIPESIPGRESLGCVRLLNKDVEFIYDFLPQGGVVEIQ